MTSLAEHILNRAKELGNKTAFFYYETGEERTLTYHDFRSLIVSFSAAIRSFQIAPGSRAILVGENSPAWPAAYLGAHLCGLTIVHGDVRFSGAEFKNIERFTNPSVILCGRAFAAFFNDATPKIYLEDIKPAAGDHEPDSTPLAQGQPMSIIFTSGTTSDPKGVMLNEANFMSNMRMFEYLKGLVTSNDRIVAILPFHHVYPFACTVLAPPYFGASVIFPRSLKGEDIFAAVKNHRATVLIAIPRVLELFCDKVFQNVAALPQSKRIFFYFLLKIAEKLQPLKINAGKLFFPAIHRNFPGFRFFACGGARLDTAVHKKLRLLGFTLLEAYGLTETSPIAAISTFADPLPGSVGRAAPGVSIKIEKADPLLEQGEICIKGPNVMMGYYKRPDLTREAITDGWFHSGDLGFIDDRGRLFITGRSKEVLVLSTGKNIYPEELEKIYRQSEKIKELCITLTTEAAREFLTVVVYPNKDYFTRHKISTIYQDIKYEIETIAQNLPAYQRVTRIELTDEELPKTALGKIRRYRVAELIKEKSRESTGPVEEPAAEDRDPFLVFVSGVLKLKKFPSLKNNLETDLGLDSLAKLDFFFAVEESYGIKITEEQAGAILTLRDIKALIAEGPQREALIEADSLEEKLSVSPATPLAEHVSTGNNPFALCLRFCFYGICRMVLSVFFKARLEGRQYLGTAHPPFIIAPNHNSYIDGLVIYGLFPFTIINNCFFISLNQIFGRFPFSLVQKIGRIILTGTHDTAIASLQYSCQVLQSGKPMCVFPEGMRTVDGNIAEPKKGIGAAAKRAGADFLPVYIAGTRALLSRKNPGLHRTRITARIFPPLSTSGPVDEFLGRWQKELQDYHDREG